MKKLLLSLLTMIISLSLMAQDGTILKLNPEKNTIYRFLSVSDQHVSQNVNGIQQSTDTHSRTVFSLKMVDGTSDFIIAEVRFDTMITNTNAMGKQVMISSALEGNMASEELADVMSCVMNRLSRNPLYVKIQPTGEVTDIMNFDMFSGIVLKDTALITGPTAPIIKTQIGNTINRKSLITMVNMFTHNLPGKEMNKGGQWEVVSPINSGGMSLDITTTYKMNDVKDVHAGVTAESTVKTSANAKPLEYSGAKITYDGLTGMGKSAMIINTSTGLIIENASKMHITGDLNVSVQGMNMQIPLEIDSEFKVTAIL